MGRYAAFCSEHQRYSQRCCRRHRYGIYCGPFPAKQAAKVSPVAAVSGNAEVSQHVGRAAKTRFLKVETSLGIHHATGAKKNLLLMTGSFALMIVLFLAFSACLDLVHKLLPSVSSFTPDISIASRMTQIL